MNSLAMSFLKRAEKSRDVQEKLLCVYDGFVSIFGPVDACKAAAGKAGIDRTRFESMLDYCMDEGDCDSDVERVRPDSDTVDRLLEALRACLD